MRCRACGADVTRIAFDQRDEVLFADKAPDENEGPFLEYRAGWGQYAALCAQAVDADAVVTWQDDAPAKAQKAEIGDLPRAADNARMIATEHHRLKQFEPHLARTIVEFRFGQYDHPHAHDAQYPTEQYRGGVGIGDAHRHHIAAAKAAE